MSTEALLETFLACPFSKLPAPDRFYHEWLDALKTKYHFGLAELMEREDLLQTITKIYRNIPLYKGTVDNTLSDEQRAIVYADVYANCDKMMKLEVLSAILDLSGNKKEHIALREELKRKYEEKVRYSDFYTGPPYTSIYSWAVTNEEAHKRLRHPNSIN